MKLVCSRECPQEVARVTESLLGQFLSRRYFTLCITMHIEAVQMPPLLQLQKLPGKGDRGWEKSVFVSFFWLTRRSRVCGKKCVLGHSDYRPPKIYLKLPV